VIRIEDITPEQMIAVLREVEGEQIIDVREQC
jgi:hypothetical protein